MLLVRPPAKISRFRLFNPNELIKRLSDDVGLALSHVSWINHVAAHAFSAGAADPGHPRYEDANSDSRRQEAS